VSYPSLPLLKTSTAERDGGFEPVRATNGVLKVRRLFSTEKTTFRLEHILTAAQWTTLWNAYTANRTANVTLTWPVDGLSYTCRFAQAPQRRTDGPWTFASVTLLEV
jgi:hypothetical protein